MLKAQILLRLSGRLSRTILFLNLFTENMVLRTRHNFKYYMEINRITYQKEGWSFIKTSKLDDYSKHIDRLLNEP